MSGIRKQYCPEPGYWMMRVRSKGPEIPAAIASCPHEPGNPENLLSTGPIMVGNIGFREVDPCDIWHGVLREITEAEYRYAMAKLAWARDYDPFAPELSPTQRVDFTEIPPIGPNE